MNEFIIYIAGFATPYILYFVFYLIDEYNEYKEDLKGRHGDR